VFDLFGFVLEFLHLVLLDRSPVPNVAQNERLRFLMKGAATRLQFGDRIHVGHALRMPALRSSCERPESSSSAIWTTDHGAFARPAAIAGVVGFP
jgi:hypothetical protein